MGIKANLNLEITFLGTGTSDGVPLIGCDCPVCKSVDSRDRRLRSSILIKQQLAEETHTIVIDSSIDFRQQLLRESVGKIDSIVYTHWHSDHMLGVSELRPLSRKGAVKLILDEVTASEIKLRFNYFFTPPGQKGGGVPTVNLQIHDGKPFLIGGVQWIPLPIYHGDLLIYGYRIGDFAYITDASRIPDKTMELLKGVQLLVLNGLRKRVHPTHLSFSQAADIAHTLKVPQCWLTHICHDYSHQQIQAMLPKNVSPAYDGLKISL